MAKKTAAKKKSGPVKTASKVVKKTSAKPAPKAAKATSKPAAKQSTKGSPKPVAAKASIKSVPKAPVKTPPKLAKPTPKPVPPPPSKKPKMAKPALMIKKGKAEVADEEEIEETRPVTKNPSVVSMMESDASTEETSKAEKTSKVKPVKIERGNLTDEKAKWAELNKKYGKDKAVQYKMSDKFTTMTPMQHKILGWGFILTNENDRLEVLFESGIRMLISNYKT